QWVTGARHAERFIESLPRRSDQRQRRRAALTDSDRHARVCVEAIQLRGDIELDEIAAAQPALAGNAVDRLVVDADAIDPGEVVVELGTRARPGASEYAAADLVQ